MGVRVLQLSIFIYLTTRGMTFRKMLNTAIQGEAYSAGLAGKVEEISPETTYIIQWGSYSK